MKTYRPRELTAVNGFVSVVCAGQRHHACRPEEWSCFCTCHRESDRASTSSERRPSAGDVHGLAGSHRDEHGSSGRGTARPGQSAKPTTS